MLFALSKEMLVDIRIAEAETLLTELNLPLHSKRTYPRELLSLQQGAENKWAV